jgi:steroid delta-isomerase-like uncharacterized protein
MSKLLALFLLASSTIASADAPKAAPVSRTLSQVDQNRALIQRFYAEVWNQGHLDVADEIFTKDYVRHDPGGGSPAPGPEGQKQIAAGQRKGFPDLVMTIDFMVADGDKVAARWTITGTNTGDLPMAKATGKKVTFSGINIYRFDHGKVVELWNHRDDLSMMMQLGLLPKPATPTKKP